MPVNGGWRDDPCVQTSVNDIPGLTTISGTGLACRSVENLTAPDKIGNLFEMTDSYTLPDPVSRPLKRSAFRTGRRFLPLQSTLPDFSAIVYQTLMSGFDTPRRKAILPSSPYAFFPIRGMNDNVAPHPNPETLTLVLITPARGLLWLAELAAATAAAAANRSSPSAATIWCCYATTPTGITAPAGRRWGQKRRPAGV